MWSVKHHVIISLSRQLNKVFSNFLIKKEKLSKKIKKNQV